MTINPEIFCSVLAALFVYGMSKHVVGVAMVQLWGKRPQAAPSHLTGTEQSHSFVNQK